MDIDALFVFSISLYTVRLTVKKGVEMNARSRFTLQNHECWLTLTMCKGSCYLYTLNYAIKLISCDFK